MSPTLAPRTDQLRTLNILKVIAGILLLVSLSWEILAGDGRHFSASFLWIQFAVCLLFLIDFFVRWSTTDRRRGFFLRNLPILLLSIPYLNIVGWSGVELSREWAMFIGLMPVLRAFLALYVIVRWLVTDRIRKLFAAYLLTVTLFTYLSALVFFDYETGVNPRLEGFGNAFWWAWMGVTTVGAAIFPVTTVGKVFSVLLPALGMLFFPIFTTYILQEYAPKKRRSDD